MNVIYVNVCSPISYFGAISGKHCRFSLQLVALVEPNACSPVFGAKTANCQWQTGGKYCAASAVTFVGLNACSPIFGAKSANWQWRTGGKYCLDSVVTFVELNTCFPVFDAT